MAKKKKNIFKSIKQFFADVIKEAREKIMWTSGKNLFKYSAATLVFMIFICLFFVATDLVIALISYVRGLF